MPTRVLVTDGSEVIRAGLCAIISAQEDMEAVGCAGPVSTDEIVAEVKRLRPDVVIANIPIYGSEERGQICDAIRQGRIAAKTIVLSALHDPDSVTWRHEPNVAACLSMQCSSCELVEAIRAAASDDSASGDALLSSTQPSEIDGLTQREREVLSLLAAGNTTKEAAGALGVSPKTIETHRLNLMNKLDSHSVANLTKLAIREGLTPLDR